MGDPNDTTEQGAPASRLAAIQRIERRYEELMRLASVSHVTDFVEGSMTMAQAKVLFLLKTTGPVRLSEIAARLRVSASTMSQMVERLVEQGSVSRLDDPADRRQVIVGLTARGEAQMDRLRELGSRQLQDTLARIDDADLPAIERVIEILIDGMAQAPRPQ